MKRLRLVFVLLSALLWVPLLFLVGFALRTVQQEEAGRYKAVADRIFDEMERELTALLRREEERSPGDYRFGDGSALALAATDAPFVRGWFERNARGGLRVAPAGAGESEIEQLLAGSSMLAAAADQATARPEPDQYASAQQALDGAALPTQSPGSTLELARKGKPQAKSYDVLSVLNRGVFEREESKKRARSKLASDEASNAVASQAWGSDGEDTPSGDALAKAAAPARPPGPFSAEPAGERHLILMRDAERDGLSVKQGLVVALPELLAWLSSRVLERGELSKVAHIQAIGAGAEARSRYMTGLDGLDRGYRHRFGEPFSAMSALLTLDTLPELEASGYSYGLSALLLVLGAVALLAGYRMVAAVVGYAERRNDFVSAVTHELKTPLTAIRMYGEMLRDDVVPDPQKRSRYYRIITAESERLSRLIDNVLELARIERGQRAVSLVMGDVTSVVRETLEVLEPHAGELGFELRLDAAPDLPSVPFDRDALAQVLFNLVDNALKYSSEADERTVTIRCERKGEAVLIRVADRGPGVAPQHLRRIWQPFYRGERELTRKHKGTGIGLALVRGLVERMGGQVTGRNTHPGFEVSVILGH